MSRTKREYPEADFRKLVAYVAREPSIEDRLEWWCSQILAALLNQWKAKGQKLVDPKTLVPDRWKSRKKRRRNLKPKSPGEWCDLLRNICVAFGGKVVDRGGERRQSGDPN